MMDIQQLKTFRMVAAMLSFSRAAVALDYAQSSVTAHIQSLEADLGVQLFNRIGKRIELTEAGHKLLDYSERLLNLVDETREVVAENCYLAGTLTIGAPETIATYRLPQVLRRLGDAAPNIRLIFRPMPYEDLYRSILAGEVDITFMLEHTIQAPSLCVEVLTSEPIRLIAASDHPLAQQTHVELQDLQGETLLLTERGCGYRNMLENRLRQAGILPTRYMEFDSVEAIKHCVMAGVGIAVLPQVAIQHEVSEGRLAVLNWNQVDFVVYTQMLWHREKWVSPAMQMFIELSREVLVGSAEF